MRSLRERAEISTCVELIRVAECGPEAIDERLLELDRELDIDRVLEADLAVTILLGLLLGARVHRGFYLLAAGSAAISLVQAVTRWEPLNELYRAIGLRTSEEIERERYALKVLRGDFDRTLRSEVHHPRRTERSSLHAEGGGP